MNLFDNANVELVKENFLGSLHLVKATVESDEFTQENTNASIEFPTMRWKKDQYALVEVFGTYSDMFIFIPELLINIEDEEHKDFIEQIDGYKYSDQSNIRFSIADAFDDYIRNLDLYTILFLYEQAKKVGYLNIEDEDGESLGFWVYKYCARKIKGNENVG